jgi:hypothetical protein
MGHIFISYSHKDKDYVHKLQEALRNEGFDVWIDDRIDYGAEWPKVIQDHLDECDAFIVVVSENAYNSKWVQNELTRAVRKKKPIFPLLLQGDPWLSVETTQYVEVKDQSLPTEKFYTHLGKVALREKFFSQPDRQSAEDKLKVFKENDLEEKTIPVPIVFRQEVLTRFFDYVNSGESFYVVSVSNVGQSSLMDFIVGDELDFSRKGIKPNPERVKKHYLGDDAAKTWLARVDMNRFGVENDWKFVFFELLLNAILLACIKSEPTDETEKIRETIATLDSEVIKSKDALNAFRFFEMTVNMLCQSYGIKLCFLFEGFDVAYEEMPREIFAHLRAVWSANKYRVCYALFLRNLPEKLRSPLENESFYELISRNMIGMGPYSQQDTYHIIEQLEKRRDYILPQNKRDWLCINSGGHPGLIQALYTIFKDRPSITISPDNANWFSGQESVNEEFRKLWAGLFGEEQDGLRQFAKGNPIPMSPATGKLLRAKGLLKPTPGGVDFFTPLFRPWALTH